MSFQVIKSGFLTTVQDYGRYAHGAHGMSRCGAMDEQAYCWANHLLDNTFDAATLEITFGGLELKALDDILIVITGADLDFRVNDKPAALWHSLQVRAGDKLTWGMPKSGIRAYLAVKGGFKTPKFFGSRSVNLREHIGRQLRDNEVLDCQASNEAIDRFIAPSYVPNYNTEVLLRLLPSYQFNEFSADQHELFFNQSYRIANASDRSGCRLEGAPITLKRKRMISEGMAYGAVEIATDGLPIILLKDAPSIGGYPKIGTVFSLDLALLAQKQPTTKVRFAPMNIADAQAQRAKFNRFFNIVER